MFPALLSVNWVFMMYCLPMGSPKNPWRNYITVAVFGRRIQVFLEGIKALYTLLPHQWVLMENKHFFLIGYWLNAGTFRHGSNYSAPPGWCGRPTSVQRPWVVYSATIARCLCGKFGWHASGICTFNNCHRSKTGITYLITSRWCMICSYGNSMRFGVSSCVICNWRTKLHVKGSVLNVIMVACDWVCYFTVVWSPGVWTSNFKSGGQIAGYWPYNWSNCFEVLDISDCEQWQIQKCGTSRCGKQGQASHVSGHILWSFQKQVHKSS